METNIRYSSCIGVDLIMQLHLIGSMDMAAFQTEEDCEKFLMKSRWDHGFFCPRCDHEEFYRVKTRGNDVEQDLQGEVHIRIKKKSTSIMAKFLFKTKRNVRYSDQVIFTKWMDACFSVYLYPHFLGYFQVR